MSMNVAIGYVAMNGVVSALAIEYFMVRERWSCHAPKPTLKV